MKSRPYWLLTDLLGQTPVGDATWLRWGRCVRHVVNTSVVHGYCTESAELPYLLDPVFERCGRGARLWLSEADEPCFTDPVRVASHSWTTVDEWRRPEWVESPAEARVRLRLALLAVGDTHPNPKVRADLRTLPLADLSEAARHMEKISTGGQAPLAVSLATMAVRAAPAEGIATHLVDMASTHYPIYAWYAAMRP
jgi:hypothetical protein